MAAKKAGQPKNLCNTKTNNAESFSTTTMRPFSQIWVIKNISSVLTKDSFLLKSSEFTDGKSTGCKWHLEGTFSNLTFSLVLKCTGHKRNNDQEVGYQFFIMNEKNETLWESDKHCFDFHLFPYCVTESLPWTLKYKELKNANRNCLKGDQLRIRCQMWIDSTDDKIIIHPGIESFESNEVSEKNVQMELLRIDHENLFMDPLFHDVVVKTSDNEFKAHRALLSARSPVFAAMFKNKMAEAENGVIKIKDFKGDIVHEMLRYIYCGEVEDLNEKNVLDLMSIADKYDIKGLQEMCVRKICSFIRVENAIDILVSVDVYDLPDLKSKLMEYIIANIGAVKKTNAFDNLVDVNPRLMTELFHKIV